MRTINHFKARPIRFRVYLLFLLGQVTFFLMGGHNRVIERNFIFLSEKTMAETPDYWGLDFEDIYFAVANGVRLHVWFVPGEG